MSIKLLFVCLVVYILFSQKVEKFLKTVILKHFHKFSSNKVYAHYKAEIETIFFNELDLNVGDN